LDHAHCLHCGMWFDSHGFALWETKDKRRIPLFQMETSHLQHCLAIIIVRPDVRPGYAKLIIEELEKRRRANEQTTKTTNIDQARA